jgi:BirA family biotin operon repressor/biotin-[acetyl-CoA-carboxylase] ligase
VTVAALGGGQLAGAAATGWRLSVHDSLGSTSDLCRERAEAGEPGGFAVLARLQAQGRGRTGRPWHSPVGNLYMSILLRPGGQARNAGFWSLVAGVAMAEMLAHWLGDGAPVALKWPNDVLLDDGEIDWLMVGCGVNVAVAPPMADRRTACMADLIDPPPVETLAWSLLDHLAVWRDRYLTDGGDLVRAAWLARAQPIGTPMTLKLPERVWAGAFAGLDDHGGLILATDEGMRVFSAGEVVLSNAVALSPTMQSGE